MTYVRGHGVKKTRSVSYTLCTLGHADMNLQGRGCNVHNARIHCGESDMKTTPTLEQLVHNGEQSRHEHA
jgi:hypothetical protein